MSVALKLPHGLLTVPEFLAWDSGDRSGRRWQLVDGVPEAMAPASDAHGSIQMELGGIIRAHLLAHRPGCRVVANPGVVPRVRSLDNARIPDLGITCAPPTGERLLQEPVLLVEILSPSNADETWANVWAYTTIPSVREILVLSSTAIAADLLRRDTNCDWPAAAQRIGTGEVLRLDSIGMELLLADAYRTSGLV